MTFGTTSRAVRAASTPFHITPFALPHASARQWSLVALEAPKTFRTTSAVAAAALQRPFSVQQTRQYTTPSNKTPVPLDDNADNNTHVYNPALNPPASTRPPPLTLPSRDPQASTFKHYFSVGKAYLTFYKTGLKAVFANRRLLRETLAAKPDEADRKPPSVFNPSVVPASYSRADWLLLWRVRHDMLRVPLFGLVLLVCGEFTPLVVLAIDGVVPNTCRLPRQIMSSMRKAEDRRRESFAYLEETYPNGVLGPDMAQTVVRSHVLRSLHLTGVMWDKLGFIMPGLWQIKGNLRMAFLEGDDRLLMQDGGLSGLEIEEVRIACAERGIDVVGKGDGELRRQLGDWLRLTASESSADRRRRMTVLLTTRIENWPATRDFSLPEWHL